MVEAHGLACRALSCSLFGQMNKEHPNIQIVVCELSYYKIISLHYHSVFLKVMLLRPEGFSSYKNIANECWNTLLYLALYWACPVLICISADKL